MKRRFWITGAVLVASLFVFGWPADAKDRFYLVFDEGKSWNRVGASTFAFLKVGEGARAAAMGDAYTAVGDDVGSIFWNPAGIGHLKGVHYALSYNRWLVDTKFYSGAVTFHTPKGVVGVSVRSFRTGAVEERTILQPQGTGRMVEGNAAVAGLTYAARPTDKLSVGIQFLIAQQTIFTQSTMTPLVDIGTHFFTGFKSVRLAMALRNLGKDVRYATRSAYMPLYFTVGGAVEVYGNRSGPTYLTVAFESAYAVDYAARWHLGSELVLARYLALRGGYKFNYSQETYSLGAGLKAPLPGGRSVGFDVSYTQMGSLLNDPIRLSLSGNF